MLKINTHQWFDLNKLGLILIALMMIMTTIFNLSLLSTVGLEIILIIFGVYFYYRIRQNKNFNLILNNENKWFVQDNEEMAPVQLKDYWIQTGRIFILLKGSNKSLSFMVSRRIIGADNFSILRSKIL